MARGIAGRAELGAVWHVPPELPGGNRASMTTEAAQVSNRGLPCLPMLLTGVILPTETNVLT